MSIDSPMERNLWFHKQVNQDTVNELSKSIIAISENDKLLKSIYSVHGLDYTPKPIKLYIDSFGGVVYQCLGLVNLMEKCTTPIHTIVTGVAMSAGFIIAIHGHKRFAYSKSTFMYHQAAGVVHGTVKNMEDELVEAKRLQTIVEDITSFKTKIPKKKLKEIYESKINWYIEADEALSLGVIDEIM